MRLRSLGVGPSSPRRDRLSEPFVALGRNALLLFVPAGLFAESMLLLEVAAAEGTAQSLRQWLYRTAFAGLAAPRPASLLYAAANPTALYVLRAWLHRRRWSWSV